MTERYLEDFEVGQMFGGSARIRIDHERITSLRPATCGLEIR